MLQRRVETVAVGEALLHLAYFVLGDEAFGDEPRLGLEALLFEFAPRFSRKKIALRARRPDSHQSDVVDQVFEDVPDPVRGVRGELTPW